MKKFILFYLNSVIWLFLSLIIDLFNVGQAADILTQVRKNLNSMIYQDSPQRIKMIGQGAYTGGNIYIRSGISELELFSFTPPTLHAGCAGIDFYGGSFSYINKDAFIQLSKTVAANALGYSFSLAMNHLCPSCGQVIESLQRKVQEMNRYLGNSCQLAQGVVHNTLDAFLSQKNQNLSLLATNSGKGDLLHNSSPVQQQNFVVNQPEKVSLYHGNIVWNALHKANPNLDKSWIEQLISITGTIVIPVDSQQKPQIYPAKVITLDDLLNKQIEQQYVCQNEDCTKLIMQHSTTPTLINQLFNTYLGNNYFTDKRLGGVFAIYVNNQGTLTVQEQGVLSQVGYGINSQLRTLLLQSVDAAIDYLIFAVNYIALDVTSKQIQQSFTLLQQAISHHQNLAIDQKQLDMIEQAQQQFNSDYARLRNLYQQDKLTAYYNNLLHQLRGF